MKLKYGRLKTEMEKSEFATYFAIIVENNINLNGQHTIVFKDMGGRTHFSIRDNNGNSLDFIRKMSEHEYIQFKTLLDYWAE
jgi:hypothetical protein